MARAAQPSSGALNAGRLSGVFTVSDFRSVNGTSQAAGWLTANVTDASGTNEIGRFTNFPIRVPVSGVLEGAPLELGANDNPLILPQLSTNTCSILGIVIGAIDITIPGPGLNVHVNEISLVVRADRETTVGEILCSLLGEDVLGSGLASANTLPTLRLTGDSSARSDSINKVLTLDQARGLVGILLGRSLYAGTDAVSSRSTSKATAASTNSVQNSFAQTKADPNLVLLQKFVREVVQTMEPSKTAVTAPKPATP
jgi:hypothetical protein